MIIKKNDNHQTKIFDHQKRDLDMYIQSFDIEHALSKLKISIPLLELAKKLAS